MFNFRAFKCFADDTNVSGGGVTESLLEPRTRVEYFLNKIAESVENSGGGSGGSSGVLVVNIIEEDGVYRFDKTAAQVYSAMTTTGCAAVYNGDIGQIQATYGNNGYVFVVRMTNHSFIDFLAFDGDDYPVSHSK